MGTAITQIQAKSEEISESDRLEEVFNEVKEIAVSAHRVDWLRRHLLTAKRALASGDKDALKAGASASSDYQATLAALPSAALTEIAENDDPLAAAHARGIEMMKELLDANGGCIKASKLARLKNVTVQAVHQQRKRGHLIAVDAGQKELLIPVWQFDKHWTVIKGIPEVLGQLKEHGTVSWDVFTFFLNPTYALSGKSPIDELRNGNIDAVKKAALLYDEHGAL